MIFVTVGTHEQQFNRLLKEIDRLKGEGIITEDVFMQTGYSDYEPKHCNYSKLLGYKEMKKYTKDASIVITHGGPGSIMMPLALGKIPIMVPRQPQFLEHVDHHQVLFTQRMEKEKKVLAVFDISTLKDLILNYQTYIQGMQGDNINSNLNNFVKRLDEITMELINK